MCLILICLLGGFFFLHIQNNKSIISEIKESYNDYITITNNTSLYKKDNNKFIKIGNIDKGLTFNLEKVDKISSKNKYLKIDNTSYYVYYKDINPNQSVSGEYNNYIIPSHKITTKDSFNLTNDNISLNINESLDLDGFVIDDNYYVNFNNIFFSIKKDDIEEVLPLENINKEKTNYISILKYNNISSDNSCNDNDCINLDNVIKNLDYLKQNEYINITIEEYQLWNVSKIDLPKKTVLILTDNSDLLNDYQNINNLSDFSCNLTNNNNASIRGEYDIVSNYNINNNTNDEVFKQMLDGKFIESNIKTDRVSVINYHFFYDDEVGEICDETLCLRTRDFEEQLRYLKYNGYKTLTMEEYTKWIYGEIELPEKSVLLTVDDGAMGTNTHLPRLLEKYDLKATLFLITAWWPKENYYSPNLDIQSHGHDIHYSSYCSGVMRGAKGLCISSSELYSDLEKSISLVDSNLSFCFPFYAYNESALQTVKDVGFKIAFIGGNRKSMRDDNKYKLPRYPIYKNTSLNEFIDMIS